MLKKPNTRKYVQAVAAFMQDTDSFQQARIRVFKGEVVQEYIPLPQLYKGKMQECKWNLFHKQLLLFEPEFF